MSGTPAWLKEKICAYYQETTEASYLRSWSGSSLAFHMGLDHAPGAPLDLSLSATNTFLAEQARLEHGAAVLDAGCGVGGSAFYLARERGASVTGITLERRQVDIARHFARQLGLDNRVRFLHGDFADAPFDPASFDVIWHIESLCYAFDLDAYLVQARQWLRPGGRLVCVDVFRGDTGDPTHHQALARGCALPAMRSQGEVAEAIARAGFRDLDGCDLTPRVLACAAVLEQMARLSLAKLRIEATLANKYSPIYEGHALGGLGAAQGFRCGAVTYGYLGAHR